MKRSILIGMLALCMLVFTVFMVACGDGEDTDTTAAATDTTAGDTDTTAAGYDIEAIIGGIEVDQDLNATLPEKIKTNGIRVGSDIPYQPWEMYVGDTEEVTGFDYDLALALGAVLGVDITFNQTRL